MPARASRTPADSSDATGFCERGLERYAAEEYDDAFADLTEAIRRDPTLAVAYTYRGIIRHERGEPEEALADLNEAIRLAPQLPDAYSWRAWVLLEQGKVDEALADQTEAIRLNPENATARMARGAVYRYLKAFPNAAADFTEALRLAPHQAQLYLSRGMVLYDLQDYDRALADLNEALRLDPVLADAFAYRGLIREQQDDVEAALADYAEALRLEPGEARTYLWRAAAYFHLEDYDDALADLVEAIRLDPLQARAFHYRGRIREEQGDLDAALADYGEVVRLDPEEASAWCDRADTWFEQDEFEKAVDDFTEAIRLDPTNREAYEGRARAWEALGDLARADADFEIADHLSAEEEPMSNVNALVLPLLQEHFDPTPLDDLNIVERVFPNRVRADLQRGVEDYFRKVTVGHFCSVRRQYSPGESNFTDLLIRNRNDPAHIVPPQYEEVDIGEDEPVQCLKDGLWLLEDHGRRFAVLLDRLCDGSCSLRFQVATARSTAGARLTQRFFKHLEQVVQEARSYRGKVLSLEYDNSYSGVGTGIKVHRLRPVQRDQVILPRKTLELLERNVLQFVRQRPRLAKRGLSTKKGLLFYGPPGTGKTHTIHYLVGALQGMTTLLISAEQVGWLGEYMTLARLLQPSMVVLEDADLIARDRTQMEVCEEVLLNKLLNEMDGLKENADILFLLTTNRPEALEAALTSRPGRVDQAIEFPFPDEAGREKLVRLYARAMRVPQAVVRATVRKTAGVSAAFIKELMRRAAQFQMERDDSTTLNLQDVDNALEELLFSGGTLNRKLLGGPSEEHSDVAE